MHLAVLAAPDSWYLRDLARAADGRHCVTAVPFSQLAAELNDSGLRVSAGDFEFSRCDAVLVRTMPPGSLEQVVFRMDALGLLAASGKLVVNAPKAVEAAVDKFLTSARLQAAGLRSPRTLVCQTEEEALLAFESLARDAVVKPLFGSEGRGIFRVNDIDLAQRAFKLLAQLGGVLYLQEFVPHEGYDLRLFVLGERVYAMRRHSAADWRTNVSRGATTAGFVPSDELVALARRAADAVGAEMAGVDILPGADGRLYVLEVNAVPGWKALAQTLEVDMAAQVLSYLAERV